MPPLPPLPPLAPAAAAHELELGLTVLLLALATFLVLAGRTSIPYPLLLVVGGLALGFLPGMPEVELEPELVLLIFLPPLLYSAAFFSSLQDLRENLRPITLLAVGLVLATTVGVAAVAHALVDGISWEAAFVLGAILSPTDPIAATQIAARVGAPRRVVAVVEGESLVNDATALVTYKVAVAAVVTGTFSLGDALGDFALGALGGAALGLAVGWIVAQVRRRLDDAPTEIAISVMTPYFAYLPAEAAGLSAVLAAVAAGIYLGWRSPILITPSTRIQAYAFWEILVFAVNAVLFALVGLQLHTVLDRISGDQTATLLLEALLIALAVMAIRIAWVFPFTYLPRRLFPRVRERDPAPPWQGPALVAWCGMRGAVSLAAALALPVTVDAGGPFPLRDELVFLTYIAILLTLLAQGLTLGPLIRAIGAAGTDDASRHEAEARIAAARAALRRLDELEGEDWVREETHRRMRGLYRFRVRRFEARLDDDDDGALERGSLAYQRLRREVLEAERAEIIRLRNRGLINDEVMRRVERDLDLEDARLELEERNVYP